MTDDSSAMDCKIIYTKVDEAPALATYSLLPIIQAFTRVAGISIETRDISLAGRIIAKFPELLPEHMLGSDDLAELAEIVKQPEANLIKLPCISASIPQLKAAISELQEKGYNLPDYPDDPQNGTEAEYKTRYDLIKGSAVNPVLRQGNSDRRAPLSVKNYARKHPHTMEEWSGDSVSCVAHMGEGDFFSNEVSMNVGDAQAGDARIELTAEDGAVRVLKEKITLDPGDIIDATVMSEKALRAFVAEQIKEADQKDLLFSVHLKATMMKVSDPIIFGHVVSTFFREVYEKHAALFKELGINPNNGLGDIHAGIQKLPADIQKEIEADIEACYAKRPRLAMVDSDRGITNLHAPNHVIIDASMPAAIRNGGRMWGPDGKLHDTMFMIPDSSYAGVYQTVIDFCKQHGAFDPTTMGSVSNVGLMAQKAEEYGSHDKTFECECDGVIRVISSSGQTLLERNVEAGDIFRMCQVKDLPIRDWVGLAVRRARSAGAPAVFWLDKERPHDAQLIKKVNKYLAERYTDGLEIHIMSPEEAAWFSCQRAREGKDTISVTGNVLRDYLTDLFPILEVGTSAKMLSIVPLISGGGMFETGAGGSAPKHVQQFQNEGHLRWDSLGEFLALAASLDDLGVKTGNTRATLLAETLDKAIERYLDDNRSPSRKVCEIDNRGSHFYLAMFWAAELTRQEKDQTLRNRFSPIAAELEGNETVIMHELNRAQGKPVSLGGYYQPDDAKASEAMRPSQTLNGIIATLAEG